MEFAKEIAMQETDQVHVLDDWPQPSGAAPDPKIYAEDGHFVLLYHTQDETYAVIEFPLCSQFIFGHPNDEVIYSHPLFKKGLQLSTVHRIENSSWLLALEKSNSVHPRHHAESFLKNKRPYIFTFHDSTLECLVSEYQERKPIITQFEDEEEAMGFFMSKIWRPIQSQG
jgi:hypothetical protein